MTLENILADFQLLDDWEDRYRYVIELGRALPPLPEAARTEANRVSGCASQVWLASEVKGATAGAARRASSSRRLRCPYRPGPRCHPLCDLLGPVRGRNRSDRCTGGVPASRVGRALDAAALEWIRLDGRAHLHRLPPCHKRRGEDGLKEHRTNKQRSSEPVQSCEESVMTFIAEDLAVTSPWSRHGSFSHE